MSSSNSLTSVPYYISPKTKYILSTSGRYQSLKRYQYLLQELLHLDITYLPYHTDDFDTIKEGYPNPVSPENFTLILRTFPCIGGAISRDIKQSVVPYVDELDESAKISSSVNTILVKISKDHKFGKKLIGYNTDLIGFQEVMKKSLDDLKSKKQDSSSNFTALLYGYGGVTNVACKVLKDLGFDVYITGRDEEKARAKSQELNCFLWNQIDQVDFFVNATPASAMPSPHCDHLLETINHSLPILTFDHELKGDSLKNHVEKLNKVYISGKIFSFIFFNFFQI